ncbi:hypothetical protein HZB89_00525 [archaeon]|nr:hypothetical protein [archaeon]
MISSVLTQKKCGVRGCYRYQCKESEAKGFTLCFVHLPDRVKSVISERKKKEEKMKEDERFKREVARIMKREKKEQEDERKAKRKAKKQAKKNKKK